jgi:two-component system sensor histidine kinase UhpB
MTSVAPAGAGTAQTPRAQPRRPADAPAHTYVPLLYRIAGINVLLVIAAVVVTIAVLAPGNVSLLVLNEELIVLLVAVAMVIVANVLLVRRVVAPVQALTAFARRVDYANLGHRIPGAELTSEAGELALTFNQMLSRLESERREATARVLRAQESERLRIAQELHDQVGQELTAVLLGLSRVSARATSVVQDDVLAIQDAVRHSLEGVRRLAIELRPEALDDLGLTSALAVLAGRVSRQLDLHVTVDVAADLPPLPEEVELVVYRVAQEALTNAARHSASGQAELTLTHDHEFLNLTVRDHGLGLPADNVAGTGMRGMRERAALIGAKLFIGDPPSGSGCEVRLEVRLGARPGAQ